MANTEKRLVLVVEDDHDSRGAICTMLESLGHAHISFGSAAEALASIQGRHIDLALLDVMMPGMNGYELLTKLRTSPEFEELPVIMITAKDTDQDVLEGYQHGADYYITKPFTARQLEYGIRIFLAD
ncbi:MAG: response regulator [Proteobacteria bacterium]|nr:response regulator [Pseudomonadota bacterium]